MQQKQCLKIFEKKDYGSNGEYCYYFLFGKEIGRKTGNSYYFFNDKYVGWHSWQPKLVYQVCGYEEGNAEIHVSLFGWYSVFKMPWKSKRFPDGDCDEPCYGIAIHDGTLWIFTGGEGSMHNHKNHLITYNFPFYTKKHVRHQVECKDGKKLVMVDYNIISEKRIFNKEAGKEIRLPLYMHPEVNVHTYKYRDSYDGEIVPCKYWVEEREWRPKWLTWTKMFADVHRYIEILFEGEVGKDKGEWKGGCVGCSYDLKSGETPLQCIKRMEKERKF